MIVALDPRVLLPPEDGDDDRQWGTYAYRVMQWFPMYDITLCIGRASHEIVLDRLVDAQEKMRTRDPTVCSQITDFFDRLVSRGEGPVPHHELTPPIPKKPPLDSDLIADEIASLGSTGEQVVIASADDLWPNLPNSLTCRPSPPAQIQVFTTGKALTEYVRAQSELSRSQDQQAMLRKKLFRGQNLLILGGKPTDSQKTRVEEAFGFQKIVWEPKETKPTKKFRGLTDKYVCVTIRENNQHDASGGLKIIARRANAIYIVVKSAADVVDGLDEHLRNVGEM